MKRTLFAVLIIVLLMSCTERRKAEWESVGDDYKVELLDCEGKVVKSWISIGEVKSKDNSIGYRFLDQKTNKLMEVSGDVIITQQ